MKSKENRINVAIYNTDSNKKTLNEICQLYSLNVSGSKKLVYSRFLKDGLKAIKDIENIKAQLNLIKHENDVLRSLIQTKKEGF